jgi:hypothetical protein
VWKVTYEREEHFTLGTLRAVPLALGLVLAFAAPVAAAAPTVVTGTFSDPGSPSSAL